MARGYILRVYVGGVFPYRYRIFTDVMLHPCHRYISSQQLHAMQAMHNMHAISTMLTIQSEHTVQEMHLIQVKRTLHAPRIGQVMIGIVYPEGRWSSE